MAQNINIDITAVDSSEENVLNQSINEIKTTFSNQFKILRDIIANQGSDLVRKTYNCNSYDIYHKYEVTKACYNPYTREISVSVKYDFLGKGKEEGTAGFGINQNCDGFHIYKSVDVLGTEIKQVIELKPY